MFLRWWWRGEGVAAALAVVARLVKFTLTRRGGKPTGVVVEEPVAAEVDVELVVEVAVLEAEEEEEEGEEEEEKRESEPNRRSWGTNTILEEELEWWLAAPRLAREGGSENERTKEENEEEEEAEAEEEEDRLPLDTGGVVAEEKVGEG